ncbi:MAG: sugar kinase [Planctomycetota bacterium]
MDRIECLAIGDLLFVLRAPDLSTLERTRSLECIVGSAEINVLSGLARLGMSTGLISKACDNFIGRWLVDMVRSVGTDTSRVRWTRGGRMGIMFVERGTPPRPSRVVYDREGSAISTLTVDEVDWEYFDRAENFFVSGITPALGENCRRVVRHAIERAHDKKKRVFFDLNFRRQLWGAEEARSYVETILPLVDVLFIKPADSREVLRTSGDPDELAEELKARFGIELVVVSLGAAGAVAYRASRHMARSFDTQVVNRFGVGDAFIAGFMYRFLGGGNLDAALDYGCAAAAIKATIPNEQFLLATREEVEALVARRLGTGEGADAMEVLR